MAIPAGNPGRNVKRIMFAGNPGDQGTPFMFHGSIAFYPRVVQPVSDELYECVKNIHKFYTIDGVNHGVLDFPRRKTLEEPIDAEEDTMVQ